MSDFNNSSHGERNKEGPMTPYDELVWVALWVERAARLAAALEGVCSQDDAGLRGAVARAIRRDELSGRVHLTLTPELVEAAQEWRLDQVAAGAALVAGGGAQKVRWECGGKGQEFPPHSCEASEEGDAQEVEEEAEDDGGDEANPILALFERQRARRGEVV
jgi:hypothetical protein